MSHANKKRKLEIQEVDSDDVPQHEASSSDNSEGEELPALVCVSLAPGTGAVSLHPKLPAELMTTMIEQMNGVAPLDNFMLALNFLYALQYRMAKLKIIDLSNQIAYLEHAEDEGSFEDAAMLEGGDDEDEDDE